MKKWLIAILFMMYLAPVAQAHPHIFITPKVDIVMNNHFVSQINVEWDFDDMSSALFLESCGSDNNDIWNTVFPPTQILKDGSKVARTGYCTYVEIDGTPVNIAPAYFKADYMDGTTLRCRFTIFINRHIKNMVKLWFDDPTMNYAFDVETGNCDVSDASGAKHAIQIQTENDIDKICLSL